MKNATEFISVLFIFILVIYFKMLELNPVCFEKFSPQENHKQVQLNFLSTLCQEYNGDLANEFIATQEYG